MGEDPLAAAAAMGANITVPIDPDADMGSVAYLRRVHEADVLLLSGVLLFLVGSYLTCRYCRCRWLKRRHHGGHPYYEARRHVTREGYTQYKSSARPAGGRRMDGVVSAIYVNEMEEPFLGPPDYEQPPPYEARPPAYEHLPSAPPLSDDMEHSPRTGEV